MNMHKTAGGGFKDAPVEAARSFRILMNAMARPGSIFQLDAIEPPDPLSPAAGTALLTLADPTTPVFLAGAADTETVRNWVAFHIGAPIIEPSDLRSFAGRGRPPGDVFAVGAWTDLRGYLEAVPIGRPDYPDRSATLIAELPTIANSGAKLSGPGIETIEALSLPETEVFQKNNARFPLGFDVFFTSGSLVAALPRSTRVEAA